MGDVAPWAYLDFYPRSPCGERLVVTVVFYRRPISIHALLAESDPDGVVYVYHNKISIHALLAESDNNVIT